MAKKYLNAGDVRMKLNRAVVFYKEKPYIVTTDTTNDWEEITITPLGGNGREPNKNIKHYDVHLDTKAPELGYMNFFERAYYLVRMPERRQNQALRSDSIIATPRIGGVWFTSPQFKKLLLGEYPKFNEALESILEGHNESVAVHRYYAIGMIDKVRVGLFNRTNLVAIRNNNDQFEYLQGKNTSFIMNEVEALGVLHG